MAQLVLLTLTALAAVAGYREAMTFARDRLRGFMDVPPLACAVACGFAGLLGAVFLPALVLAALWGIVGYHGAHKLEEQWCEAPFGLTVPVSVVGCAVFGLGGALLTSTVLWLVVSGFLALVGALWLLIEERNTLVDEKRLLLAANRRLLGDKSRSGSNVLATSPSVSPRSLRSLQPHQPDTRETQSHTSPQQRPHSSHAQKRYLFGDPPPARNGHSINDPVRRRQGDAPARPTANETDFLPQRPPRPRLWWRLVDARTLLAWRDDEIRARIERVAAEVAAESTARAEPAARAVHASP